MHHGGDARGAVGAYGLSGPCGLQFAVVASCGLCGNELVNEIVEPLGRVIRQQHRKRAYRKRPGRRIPLTAGVEWAPDATVIISYPSGAKIYTKVTKVDNYAILYRVR